MFLALRHVTTQVRDGITRTLTYDGLDHLVRWNSSVNGQEEWNLYDASGERVLRRTFDGTNTVITVYAFGEEHQYSYSGSGSNATDTGDTYYYNLGGQEIGTWDGVSPTTDFLLTDTLGSVVSSFNNLPNGGAIVLGDQVYGPYGNQRVQQGMISTSKGFTGQYTDFLTGLDYYGARYYDPVVGVFVSADTVQGNVQGMDPYSYVGGNPETETDPTGNYRGTATGGQTGGGGGSQACAYPGSCGTISAASGGEGTGSGGGSSSGIGSGGGSQAGPTQAQKTAAAANFSWRMCMSSNACSANYWKERAIYAAQKTIADIALAMSLAEVFVDPQSLSYWQEQEQNLEREMETEQEVATAMQGVTCSFAAQTAVTTIYGKQEISKLHPGEKVWSYNPKTHKMEWQPIVHVWVTHDSDLVNLTITPMKSAQSGKEKTQQGEVIQTNQKHRFLTTEKGFLPVGEIVVGMHIVQADGGVGVVTHWETKPGSQTMYNLEVAHDHTYVVGNQQWVVHNECWSLAKDEALGGHTIGNNHVINEDGSNFDRVLERLGPPENKTEASAFYSMADAEDAISYTITTGNITVRNSKTLIFDATYTREVGFVATSQGGLEASDIVKVIMNKNSSGIWFVRTAYLINPNP